EQLEMPLHDNVVDEESSGGGRDQSGRPADHDQDEANDQSWPTGPHQFLEQRLDILNQLAGLLLVRRLPHHGVERHHRSPHSLPRLTVLRARVTGRNFFSYSDWAFLSFLRSRNASSRPSLDQLATRSGESAPLSMAAWTPQPGVPA